MPLTWVLQVVDDWDIEYCTVERRIVEGKTTQHGLLLRKGELQDEVVKWMRRPGCTVLARVIAVCGEAPEIDAEKYVRNERDRDTLAGWLVEGRRWAMFTAEPRELVPDPPVRPPEPAKKQGKALTDEARAAEDAAVFNGPESRLEERMQHPLLMALVGGG